jgi:hypothetical protein
MDEPLMADDLIAPGEDVQTPDPNAEKPDKPVGIFQLDDELVKRLRTLHKRALDHQSKRRADRKKEWDAHDNDQWEDATSPAWPGRSARP